jgi:hypothetical protein
MSTPFRGPGAGKIELKRAKRLECDGMPPDI